jgi:hypothetical protein
MESSKITPEQQEILDNLRTEFGKNLGIESNHEFCANFVQALALHVLWLEARIDHLEEDLDARKRAAYWDGYR